MLIIEIAGHPRPDDASSERRLFSRQGGSIGRSSQCDLVLSAPGVSRRHADIFCRDGTYYLNDRSRNGTRLNGRAMARGETASLASGDRFEIDRFELRVRIGEESEIDLPFPPEFDAVSAPAARRREDDTGGQARRDASGSGNGNGFYSFRGPDRRRSSADLPPTGRDNDISQAGASARAHIDRMGREELHAILRAVVEGLMHNLRTRSEIKNTFRLSATRLQDRQNNPLKFAPDAEEALDRVLAHSADPKVLTGEEALDDAFSDIRDHQVAMLAGMRAAFDRMLVNFDPAHFERTVDKRLETRGSRLVRLGRSGERASAYWTQYREEFERLSDNPEERFQRLFGDEFVKAYEEQLALLRMRKD
ncbi:MAG: type VI secretion system-associated FHA domain protein TagH [Salinisphaeraceae bacterium]|nr:type VI secretion system-associated FHA domain protein TagH [Salinisphaeraceae bacterium]